MTEAELPSPETLLGLGEPILSAREVAAKAGLDLEDAKRLWRAMGFAVIPETERYFTESDVEVLQELTEFMRAGFADLELVLGITRAMSQSLGRITEAEVEAIRQQLTRSPELAQTVVASEGKVAMEALEALEKFLVYVWRRHLAGALQRAQVLEPRGSAVDMSVGFADLVGFTRLSRQVDEDELQRIIERFETVAQDVATATGGRIVKTIGDEVMFVADEPEQAAELALGMAEGSEWVDDGLEVRVGVALGDLTAHHGDYFGPVVNLASRAARVAHPNAALVSEELAGALGDASYELKPIPRRRLKGIGSPQLYVLRRPG